VLGGPSKITGEGAHAERVSSQKVGAIAFWGAREGCCGPLCSWGVRAGVLTGVLAAGHHLGSSWGGVGNPTGHGVGGELGVVGLGARSGLVNVSWNARPSRPGEIKGPAELRERGGARGAAGPRAGEGQPWPDAATPPSSSALHINANALA